jgi:ABC-2 type transport system permease protein
MSSKTLIVAGYEFRKTIGRRSYLFISLVIPLLLVATVFVALPVIPELLGGLGGFVGFEEQVIGYVDGFEFLEPVGSFVEFEDVSSATEVLREGNITGFFVVENSYFEDGNITYYTTGSTEFSEPWGEISWILRTSLMKRWGYPDEQTGQIIRPFNASVVKLDGGGAVGSAAGGFLEFLLPYGFAIFLMISIFMSSGFLMQGIGEEKENRTGELLLSSISSDQLMRGKMLGFGAAGIIQTSVYALAVIAIILFSPIAPLFAGIQLGGLFVVGVIYFFMGYALFSSSISATASISSSAKEAQQSSMIFTMMGVIPLALVTLIIREPNSAFAVALTYIPYTSPFTMMMRMSLTSVPLYEILGSLAILAVSIFIVSKLAGKIFRMGMLKYDKRATLKEIFGFLREK